MEWVHDDGGRAAAGFKGEAGDCVCRAISIATEKPYREIYDLINSMVKDKKAESARSGVKIPTIRKVMDSLGWKWVPTMRVGQGCRVHLRPEELPKGRLVVSVSRHETAVIDGVIHDTFDPSRDGFRCVYGYYVKGEDE